MYLTKHQVADGTRWALNGRYLSTSFRLDNLLSLKKTAVFDALQEAKLGDTANDPLLPPIEAHQEIWACGVTYLRSREARKAESDVADVYERVYDAERPELFFKSIGWRAQGHCQSVTIRKDSSWDVPEPEFTLIVNTLREIVGYCAGNDMSSRSIEGENPLYLPQAKMYRDSCAIGPGLLLLDSPPLDELAIDMQIVRQDTTVFSGETNISQMKRKPQELVDWLFKEMDFPHGVLLMTGTGLVPPEAFTLQEGDDVKITIGELTLENSIL